MIFTAFQLCTPVKPDLFSSSAATCVCDADVVGTLAPWLTPLPRLIIAIPPEKTNTPLAVRSLLLYSPSELNCGFAIVASIDDPLLVEALEKYHREKLDNNRLISQRLKADYGIEMG